ncbi:hypothetical protein [Oceanobacillus massiliensis]|uniref:hypothetical protein n=1 Tax=Oceanobacillus massiliensis TaxID=1465765 RepID=UPI0002898D44|nr:hypothetical protein [Oceanobacillus massiliensis]
MVEQEQYKNMLKRMISETEDCKIRSSEEMIRMLVNELARNKNLEKYTQSLVK